MYDLSNECGIINAEFVQRKCDMAEKNVIDIEAARSRRNKKKKKKKEKKPLSPRRKQQIKRRLTVFLVVAAFLLLTVLLPGEILYMLPGEDDNTDGSDDSGE